MTAYVLLLRGINVGGGNIVKMADLKTLLEAEGFSNVATYIQSGNVVFTSSQKDKTILTEHITAALHKRFGYNTPVVLLSARDMMKVMAQAPQGFGSQPQLYRYDVIFIKEPLTVGQALQNVTLKEGVDTVAVGDAVLYFSRLIAQASSSHLARIITQPMYKNMTIRNWNTTSRLAQMVQNIAT